MTRRRTIACCGLLPALLLSGCLRLQTRRWPTEPREHDAVEADGAVRVSAERTEAAEPALAPARDGGRSFAAPTRVNDDANPCGHGMHSLAVSVDGRVYVAWLDERDIEPKEADPANALSHMHEH